MHETDGICRQCGLAEHLVVLIWVRMGVSVAKNTFNCLACVREGRLQDRGNANALFYGVVQRAVLGRL